MTTMLKNAGLYIAAIILFCAASTANAGPTDGMMEVSSQEIIEGLLEGGGPDVSGLLKDLEPTMNQGIVISRRWGFQVNEDGMPVARGGRFVVIVRCSQFHSRRVPIFACFVKVIDTQTKLIHSIGHSVDTPSTSCRQASGLAMKMINTMKGANITGRVNTKPAWQN